MTRESLLVIIGILLVLSPFLGFPYTWLMVLVPVLALAVIVIGISLRARRSLLSRPATPQPHDPSEA